MLRSVTHVVSSCERGNEPLGSIQRGNFLDQLSVYYVLKKDSAPWKVSELISVLNSKNVTGKQKSELC